MKLSLRLLGVLLLAITPVLWWQQIESKAAPAEKRPAWTESRVVGSPDAPHPFRVVPAFAKLQFKNPVHMTSAPGTDRMFVCEQKGQILSFPNKNDVEKADLVIDVSRDLKSWAVNERIGGFDAVYGLTFHPKFAENRYCYVCYVLAGKKGDLPDGSRVSRFTMSKSDPPRIDPSSEKVLLTFRAGGHNGGCLVFGPDRFLYISTGDAAAPNPPDVLNTGQDCSDLLSSVLRIDIDREEGGLPYAIPKDNPFVGMPNVRPEIWAFGFRNPWKMSFDRATGQLWLGDVGWEMWEMVYRVRKGGNYGWSVKEGPQSIKPEDKLGPTPILPPDIAFPHTEAASITGGFVYRGKKHPSLVGAYICGDWMSRKFWATRFDGERMTSHTELAQGNQKIITFAEDNDGELYFLDYNDVGGIYTLVPDPDVNKPRPAFPKRLSETGLFRDTAQQIPNAGVHPYSIAAEPWMDGATADRWVAVPGNDSIRFFQSLQSVPDTAWFKTRSFFPKNSVIARTISIESEVGNPSTRRKLETQLMHFDGREWRGYTYRWSADGTDAHLVPAAGEDIELTVKDARAPGGERKQTWHFPSRTECRQCHNPWAGDVLGLVEHQLRNTTRGDEFARFEQIGLFTRGTEKDKSTDLQPGPLVNPHDTRADLDVRARSYLHVNCAHCHQFGGGGSVNLELKSDLALDQMKVVDAPPVQGTFGIGDCRIVAPGDPQRSVLYYRIVKQGRGRMPHIGSELVDENGTRLIRDWIRRMPPRLLETMAVEKCCQPTTKPADRDKAIASLLATPNGALALQEAWDAGRLPGPTRDAILVSSQKADATVRDLFERYVPDSQRIKRLGTAIRPESILSLTGDAARGKQLFLQKNAMQCATCHKVGKDGGSIGPGLSDVGKRLGRRQLLESILDPSKDIDAKFAAFAVETEDGRKLTGLIVASDATSITVRDPQGKDVKLLLSQIASKTPSRKSLMPDQLLRDLTAQQAADLIAFLESLK